MLYNNIENFSTEKMWWIIDRLETNGYSLYIPFVDEETVRPPKKEEKTMPKKNPVPVFFATDENYVPYLTVALVSLKEKISADRTYNIYILHSGMNTAGCEEIKALQSDAFKIKFVNVSKKLERLSENLAIRDYYSFATYFRIFIAGMFPEFDKAVYLDSDIIVNADIAEFFDIELNDNELIGAVPDGAVQVVPEMQDYVEKALGVPYGSYFNAGVILMNLKKFRDDGFYTEFNDLLGKYRFKIAQDQDYLNVICNGKVKVLGAEWNAMPNWTKLDKEPKIVHYNLTAKPWHYENLPFETYFWTVAKRTEFYEKILAVRDAYGEKEKSKDRLCEEGLIKMCVEETENENNYYKTFVLNGRK